MRSARPAARAGPHTSRGPRRQHVLEAPVPSSSRNVMTMSAQSAARRSTTVAAIPLDLHPFTIATLPRSRYCSLGSIVSMRVSPEGMGSHRRTSEAHISSLRSVRRDDGSRIQIRT